MHQCLRISEIFRIVIKSVSEDRANRRKNLLSLAQTCRTFHSLAIDELWKSLENFVQLLKCLPDDLWHIDEDGVISFFRPILPTDWDRFRYYAIRVQTLKVGADIAVEALRDIAVYSRPHHGYLLPNVRVVSFSVKKVDFAAYLPLFLNPNLRSLTLHDRGCDTPLVLSRFGDLLGSLTPKLEKITLTMPLRKSIGCIPGTLTSSASQLQHLMKFSWRLPLLLTDLMCLGSLPQLNHISMVVPDNITDDSASLPEPSMFPALRILELRGRTFPPCTRLLEILGKRSFQSVLLHAFEASDYQEGQDIRAALECIRQNSSDPDVFRSLTLRTSGGLTRKEYIIPITLLIENLSVFRNISEFILDTYADVDGDDDDLSELARMWPLIQTLKLGAWPWAEHTSFTIRGLSAFARYCPFLESLTIAFDGELEDEDADQDDAWEDLGMGEHLTYLMVANSPVLHPLPVARLLCRMFPYLARVEGDDWRGHLVGEEAPWDTVDKYVFQHRQCRENEDEEENVAWTAGDIMASMTLGQQLMAEVARVRTRTSN